MLRDARTSAGLSARALAIKAGTSTTTVTRIEAGTMDPTVGMLDRLLRASGRQLEFTTRPRSHSASLSLADLTCHAEDRLVSEGGEGHSARVRFPVG